MSTARPMTPTKRAFHYCETEDSKLTPAQMRRFRHKFNRFVGSDYRMIGQGPGMDPEQYAAETGLDLGPVESRQQAYAEAVNEDRVHIDAPIDPELDAEQHCPKCQARTGDGTDAHCITATGGRVKSNGGFHKEAPRP